MILREHIDFFTPIVFDFTNDNFVFFLICNLFSPGFRERLEPSYSYSKEIPEKIMTSWHARFTHWKINLTKQTNKQTTKAKQTTKTQITQQCNKTKLEKKRKRWKDIITRRKKTPTGTSRHLDRGCRGIVHRLRRSIHSCSRNWGRFNSWCYCCGIECLRGIGISCRSQRHIIGWNGIVLWQGVVRPGWRISSLKRERVKL